MAYSQIGVTDEMLFMLCDINPGEPNREEFLKLVKALNYGHNKAFYNSWVKRLVKSCS